MEEFIGSVVWHGSAFLRSRNGETWRVWYGSKGEPLIERMTVGDGLAYRIPIDELRREGL